jgi:hypothetical protein
LTNKKSKQILEEQPMPKDFDKEEKMLFESYRLEIDLYWKRTAYFWTITGAVFAGYFAIAGKNSDNHLILLIESLGVIVSFGWLCVNRGSINWCNTWLEQLKERDNCRNLLSRKVVDRKDFLKFWRPYHYSMSRVNSFMSFFVFIVWIVLIAGTDGAYFQNGKFNIISIFINLITAIFILTTAFFGISSEEGIKKR